MGLTRTAFDILLFLANNPSYKTARDIVEVRHIKANLVSVNVDRLVREGYLMRQPVAGDRRKTELVCTPQAQDAICRGRQLQEMFFDRLLDGMDDGMRLQLLTALETISKNLDALLKEAE